MRPNAPQPSTLDLFKTRLENIIDMNHELVLLAQAIDWEHLSQENAKFYPSKTGRPGVNARLMIGLHLLKHMYDLSDEQICLRWVENPYYQYFCGEEFFCHQFPMERSSMTHWRKRVGETFCQKLLQESLATAHRVEAIDAQDVHKVIVDTTVQSKAITHPTDAKLLFKALLHLGKKAKQEGVLLRQHYGRVSKVLMATASRYLHAKQFKRARRSIKKIRTYLGRVIRDIERKIAGHVDLENSFQQALKKARHLFYQEKHDSDKLYSWHEPEVECICKGKADKPYEFGCKVSVVTNLNPAAAGHFILHAQAFHGRPYDGHTLNQVMTEFKEQIGIVPKRVYVDKGYRGHDYANKTSVFISGQKRGVTKRIKKELKRRSAIEPVIGHMKNEGRLGRNYLKGKLGDKLNALFVAAGYNFKQILNYLRILFAFIFYIAFSVDVEDSWQPA